MNDPTTTAITVQDLHLARALAVLRGVARHLDEQKAAPDGIVAEARRQVHDTTEPLASALGKRDHDTQAGDLSPSLAWRDLLNRITQDGDTAHARPTFKPHEMPEFINGKTQAGRVQEWDPDSGDDIPMADFGTPEEAREFAYKMLAAADYIEQHHPEE